MATSMCRVLSRMVQSIRSLRLALCPLTEAFRGITHMVPIQVLSMILPYRINIFISTTIMGCILTGGMLTCGTMMSHGMNTTPMNESCTVDVEVFGFRAARCFRRRVVSS